MKISAVIIAFNEEDRLTDALISCQDIADEIIVIDSYSTDKTVEIAKKNGAIIIQNEFKNYGDQKNFAMKQASNNWVLNLDADERISEELKSEILNIKMKDIKDDNDFSAYKIKRKTSYLGRWIKHSGWYPDKKIRLFKKDKSHWEGRIHEGLIVEGPISSELNGDILHYTYRDVTDHIKRLNRYSKMQVEDIVKKGKKLLYLRVIILPPITFVRFYVWKMGVLDGFPGFLIALISSWSTAMKYIKAIELNRKK